MLAAIRERRRHDRAIVLVTRRIQSELRAVLPEVEEGFDAIVRLGLGCQLVHDRQALLVLHGGATKATGLIRVLDREGDDRLLTERGGILGVGVRGSAPVVRMAQARPGAPCAG